MLHVGLTADLNAVGLIEMWLFVAKPKIHCMGQKMIDFSFMPKNP